MNYSTYLEYIESNIDDVVTVQKRVKKLYKNLDKDSLDDIADIKQGLQDEKNILNGLMNKLKRFIWYPSIMAPSRIPYSTNGIKQV